MQARIGAVLSAWKSTTKKFLVWVKVLSYNADSKKHFQLVGSFFGSYNASQTCLIVMGKFKSIGSHTLFDLRWGKLCASHQFSHPSPPHHITEVPSPHSLPIFMLHISHPSPSPLPPPSPTRSLSFLLLGPSLSQISDVP